jgi:hypothetical protein
VEYATIILIVTGFIIYNGVEKMESSIFLMIILGVGSIIAAIVALKTAPKHKTR